MSFIDEMRNLREDIESGKKIRSRRIEEIKKDVKATTKENQAKQRELQKMLSDAQVAFWGKE